MTKSKNHIKSICTAIILLASLSACQATTMKQAEGIGYREARFAEVAAVRKWQSCHDDATELDRQARKGGDPAKYLASANLLVHCEAELGSDAASAAKDARFRAYALAVLNFMKAGDISATRESLQKLRIGFPEQDLYLPNGASFIDSMEVLTGAISRESIHEFPMRNISKELKQELRRIRYWKSH